MKYTNIKLLSRYLCNLHKYNKKVAFTLSEIILVIGILGVVMIVLLPTLMEKIEESVNSRREAITAFKITQAFDKMRALNLLNRYSSTDNLVDELQKHLKIIKRCNASNIVECWPTKTVTTSNGEIFEIKNAKLGENLNHDTYTTNNVGLVLADGTAIILTYDQDTEPLDMTTPVIGSIKTLPVGNGKTEDFAYTTNSTSMIDFVMDVNGTKGPNSETINGKLKDIRSFRTASFNSGCAGIYAGEMCVSNIMSVPAYINCSSGNNAEYCGNSPSGSIQDYWAAANKLCISSNMSLPTLAQLRAIKLSLGYTSGKYWTNQEYVSTSANLYYMPSGTTVFTNKTTSSATGVLCVDN